MGKGSRVQGLGLKGSCVRVRAQGFKGSRVRALGFKGKGKGNG